MILLEETPSRTWQCITGKHMEKRYYLEDVDASPEEIEKANEALEDNFVIYDHSGDNDFDSINRIKATNEYFLPRSTQSSQRNA